MELISDFTIFATPKNVEACNRTVLTQVEEAIEKNLDCLGIEIRDSGYLPENQFISSRRVAVCCNRRMR